MEKRKAAILILVMILGLLFLRIYRDHTRATTETGSNTAQQENARQQEAGQQGTAQQEAAQQGAKPEGAVWQNAQQDEALAENTKKIALSFDDGPHPSYTEQLLDGLKERGVHVTFFVTGEHAELHPDIIKRMQEEGHLLGNHTYSHIQLRKGNREEFKEELLKTNEVLKEITGEDIQYVRPPYGSWDKSFEKELNMFPVLWTIDPLDWCSQNSDCIVQNVVAKAEENGIILMHDYYETSVEAALEIVDKLMEEGYEFVTVEEILFD